VDRAEAAKVFRFALLFGPLSRQMEKQIYCFKILYSLLNSYIVLYRVIANSK
jgi:hypothetical protein